MGPGAREPDGKPQGGQETGQEGWRQCCWSQRDPGGHVSIHPPERGVYSDLLPLWNILWHEDG